jgi:hypothetical protein
LWLCAGLVVVIRAGAAQDEVAERTRMERERANVESVFVERERACQKRFAVTACVDEARRERRDALALLRRQEALLDEAQRKERAAQRMQAIRDKVSSGDAQQRDMADREPREAARKPAELASTASTPAPREPATAKQGKTAPQPATPSAKPATRSTTDRAAQEARSKERFKASQEAAAEHRAAVERRNAQRAAKGKAASPLPTPPGASAP